MRTSTQSQRSRDGIEIHVRRFAPDGPVRATLQIVHGMGEHSARYARFAELLCEAGFEVIAADTRGHGRSLAGATPLGHLADHDGWSRAVDDVADLAERIAAERPDVPHAILGHSMGSLLVLDLLTQARVRFAAAILSGTSGPPGRGIALALAVARFERLRLGARGHSPLLQRMLFGRFNTPFEPAETEFDWLSRDRAEVARYVADPLCGFVLSVGGLCDLALALRRIFAPESLLRIPRDLPVRMISGERDPVHDSLRGFHALTRALRVTGHERLSERVFPGARHELLNETNRDEVTAEILGWLVENLETPRR